MEQIVLEKVELDNQKINIVKPQLRKRWKMWFSFLLFGWSYGSLGNLGLQLIWYTIPVVTIYGIYEYNQTHLFTIYTSMAVVGLGVWLLWGLARIMTLNKAIENYNRGIANFYGLTDDEKKVLGIS
jgi:hypothetical protein